MGKGIYCQGKDWYVDCHYKGERFRKKIGPNKRLAEQVLNKVRTSIIEGASFKKKNKCKIKLKDMNDQYLEDFSKIKKRSYSKDLSTRKRLEEFFGKDIMLRDITTKKIEKYQKFRKEEGKADATINREIAYLKHMFTKAIDWEITDQNPAKKVKQFKENNERSRYLTREEYSALINSCKTFIRPIIIMAVNTGMRQGELLNLRWSEVDFIKNNISVTISKNNKPRKVPMNSTVRNVLNDMYLKRNPNIPYVFVNKNGNKFSRFGRFRKAFRDAVKVAGISNFVFHDCRHTFASYMIMSGSDLLTLKEILGHLTLKMVERYAHLSDKHKQKAVDQLCNIGLDTFSQNIDNSGRALI